MNTVERVKAICKQRKIALSKLEKDCGFGNAYISQLKKGVFPDDRLITIAQYLDLDPRYLLTGNEEYNHPMLSAAEIAFNATYSDKKINPNFLMEIGYDKKSSYLIELFNLLDESDKDAVIDQVLNKVHHQLIQDSHE